MKTRALIERGADGSYGIYTPDLQSTISGNGKTLPAAMDDFRAAYEEVKAAYQEMGKPVPDELQEVEFEYQYDLGAFYDAHPYLNVSQTAQYIGVNAALMRQYRRGQYISRKQLERIQEGIRAIGRELSEVSLVV